MFDLPLLAAGGSRVLDVALVAGGGAAIIAAIAWLLTRMKKGPPD